MTTTVVLLDGLRRVDPATPVLRADDLGVLRGESVFETVRIAAGRLVQLDEHLARMRRSAARLDLALPDGWAELAAAAVDRQDGVLRLVCSKGGVGYALVTDVPEETLHGRRHGVDVVTLTLGVTAAQREGAPWLLGGVKSTSYAVNMATLREAHARGAGDALWLSSDGWVLEAPTATAVLLLDGELVTPPVATGVLPGTTVLAVDRLRRVTARPVSVEDLARAEEMVLVSSVRGVAPVTSVDGRALATTVGRELSDALELSLR